MSYSYAKRVLLIVDGASESRQAEEILLREKIPYRRSDLGDARAVDFQPPLALTPFGDFEGVDAIKKYAPFVRRWLVGTHKPKRDDRDRQPRKTLTDLVDIVPIDLPSCINFSDWEALASYLRGLQP